VPEAFAAFRKGAPQANYAALVEAEMAKGFSPTVAQQRAAPLNPAVAASVFSKQASRPFDAIVDQIARDEKISNSEAMMRARRMAPAEYARYQEG